MLSHFKSSHCMRNHDQNNCENPQMQLDHIMSENICNEFEHNGQLIFRDATKLVIRKESFVLKELMLSSNSNTHSASCNNHNKCSHVDNTSSSTSLMQSTLSSSSSSSQSSDCYSHQSTEMGIIHSSRIAAYDSSQMILIEQKRMQDCQLMKNEFAITQQIQSLHSLYISSTSQASSNNDLFSYNILAPAALGKSKTRLLLLSRFMNRKDSWSHLISRNEGIFKYIKSLPNDVNMISELQRSLLLHVRFILFGVMKLIAQIGTALYHLHTRMHIAHNDIKPDNFFAHMHGNNQNSDDTTSHLQINQQHSGYSQDDDLVSYYLGDFGYAKPIGFNTIEQASMFFSMKKCTYLSPEILAVLRMSSSNERVPNSQKQEPFDLSKIEMQGDIFAFGVSIFQILFQVNPFSHSGSCEADDEVYAQLSINPNLFWQRLKDQLSIYSAMTNVEQLKHLLENMLHRDAKQRLTIEQVLSHPWMQDINNYLFSE